MIITWMILNTKYEVSSRINNNNNSNNKIIIIIIVIICQIVNPGNRFLSLLKSRRFLTMTILPEAGKEE